MPDRPLLAIAAALLAVCLAAPGWLPAVAAAPPPNVVLIMADDIGWECFGAYGGQDYQTPRLDELCRTGVRFTHCYSTRPHHFGFDQYLLWQLTRGRNVNQGGGERYWSPLLEQNGRLLSIAENDGQYGPDMMCDFLCDFIDDHQDRPFFVYYPMMLVHDPFVPTPETVGEASRGHDANKAVARDKQKNFAAMVHHMDKIVGRIVDQLDSLGQLENTLVLFTADNGTHRSITSTWQDRSITGGKGGTTDMGTHVPLIAYWKGRTPDGAVVEDLLDFTDFYPTLAELIGADAARLDGRSFLPQLLGQPGNPRRWVLCHYQPFWSQQPGQFARTETFKLYPDDRLYNVPVDLNEQRPISAEEASSKGNTDRSLLAELLRRAPPLPQGQGNKDSHRRETYPRWPQLDLDQPPVAEPTAYRVDFDRAAVR